MPYARWKGANAPVSNGAVVTRLALEANEDAPRTARAALASLGAGLDDDVLERASLLTSEVVTNAVRFSGGAEVRVDMWRAGSTVAVVTSDDGPGFDPVALPGTIAGAESDGGFGLPLLDTLSEAWGSGTHEDSWVWFEVSPRISARPASRATTKGDDLLDIRMVVESVKNHALVAMDRAGNVTNWGSGPVELTGYPADEMLGRPLSELYVPASATTFDRDMERTDSEGWHSVDRWLRRKDGTQIWAEVTLAPIRDRSGRKRGLSALISDITERKRAGDAREHLIADLREQALTDELTGLPNRRRFSQELARELARSRRQGSDFAIAMLDLDGFKAFNDTHGHPGGDKLLRAVSREWSAALRESDLLGRLGGDEFAITLPDCAPDLALAVVARMQDATHALIGSSAGIASSQDADSPDGLLARADEALYAAKRGPARISTDGAVTSSREQ
jgi:diguanylate cyclase (GGDEF)-like protein/PAS domain S-box-containing protein